MKENLNINELLNGFIDDELSPRHKTEVQRLVAHDPVVAKQLDELKRFKMLVGSLPHSEAPAEMVEDIRAAVERRSLLGHRPEHIEYKRGAIQLFARKVMTAAAMIGLVGVFFAVIYSILAPGTAPEGSFAVKTLQPGSAVVTVSDEKAVAEAVVATTGFEGRLELTTGDFSAAGEFVKTVLQNHGLWQTMPGPSSHGVKRLWSINCGQENLKMVLADLSKGWDKFDSSVLLVDSGKVTVDKVTAGQIAEIAAQREPERRIKAAKYFAIANNMAGRLPGEKALALNEAKPDLATIPKPVLTSSEQKSVDETQGQQNVRLTIVLVGSK